MLVSVEKGIGILYTFDSEETSTQVVETLDTNNNFVLMLTNFTPLVNCLMSVVSFD